MVFRLFPGFGSKYHVETGGMKRWHVFSQKLDHLANTHSLQKCRRYCMVHFPEQIWTDPKKVGVKIEETISVEPITVSFSWILGKPRSLATTRGKEICRWMAVDMESDWWFFISNISKIWTEIYPIDVFTFCFQLWRKDEYLIRFYFHWLFCFRLFK